MQTNHFLFPDVEEVLRFDKNTLFREDKNMKGDKISLSAHSSKPDSLFHGSMGN